VATPRTLSERVPLKFNILALQCMLFILILLTLLESVGVVRTGATPHALNGNTFPIIPLEHVRLINIVATPHTLNRAVSPFVQVHLNLRRVRRF
jgi:hypothetical protein